MPLIVPGITPASSDNKPSNDSSQWQQKLMGKKIGTTSDNLTFAKKDLPQESRVIEHGGFGTMDHKPERLNVHLDKDGTVGKVTKG